ncbi:retrovirus-related pol polyprotein from transposon RE1 [Citrus sinensis]|nr:retrovirus-related pol polyprotein from transposon RE1 [Citrus sinensis]
MASSSNTISNQTIINSNQHTQTSFTFAATVKLDRSNFLLWPKQVVTSIRGNRLERFILEPQIIPEQYLVDSTIEGSGESIENPAYSNWRAQDQILLGWLLSTISEGILSSVLSYDTSFDVWRSIEKQFGVQSEAKIMQVRYEMNILRKDSMNVEEYCAKMKLLANKLACAGDVITEKDLLIRVLNGLGSGYLDLASIITTNKMSYDDAYALLLTHEARLEQNQTNMHADGLPTICQICHKTGHAADECWHRYDDNPQPSPRHFGRGRSFGSKATYIYDAPYSSYNHLSFSSYPSTDTVIPEAYLTNYEGPADEGWYLDSGATHHLTNSMANMNVREEFRGSDQLIIGNGQVHKGYKCLHSSGKMYIARNVVFDESTFPYSTDSVFHSNESSSYSSQSLTPQQVFHLTTLSTTPVSDGNSSCNPLSAISTSSSSQHSDNPFHTNNQHSYSQTHITFIEPSTEPQNSPPQPAPDISLLAQPTPDISFPVQLNTHPMTTRSKNGIFKPKLYTATLVHKEPDSVYEAMQNPKWVTAMKEEYAALMQSGTWSLVPKTNDQRVVGNKWVYRVKYNTDGSVAKYKARLVAKGFQQIIGVNCFETFSPVIKPATVRVVLSLAVMNQWKIRQVDVNNAFLNGDLTEEVFMDQPEGFISFEKPDFVCNFHKSLYGLKQAPRAWYDKLIGCLLQLGFTNSSSDTSLFLKINKSSMILVLIYVDDILITGPNSFELEKFITEFSTKFALKDLGVLSYFLGIEVLYDKDCIFLSQRKYIRDLLSRVEMINCKDIDTLMSTGMKLQKEAQGNLGCYVEDITHYRSIVGGMQYLVLTRPEIAFSVHKLSQYVSAPTLQHLMACKRVLRYLKATQNYGLKFIKDGDLKLTGFTDADWAGDLDDRKSIGAYCICLGHNLISCPSYKQMERRILQNGDFLNLLITMVPINSLKEAEPRVGSFLTSSLFGHNLISWSSKKQPVIARSSAESEYRSLASASAEISWLQSLFSELKLQCIEKPVIWCENLSATELAHNPIFHSRTKHIEIDIHYVRNKVLAGELNIQYIPSEEQVADIMTKPLSFIHFNYLRAKLNVMSCPLSLRGAVKAAHYSSSLVKPRQQKVVSEE